MFGNNAVTKQRLRPDGSLFVKEVFHTIQGEGPFAGCPAVFVRLVGCNLRCWFCDTNFESDAPELLSVETLSNTIRSLAGENTALVVLTGGEPLLQNIVPLIETLDSAGMQVQIETAGTVWVPGLEDTIAQLVCSPKTARLHPLIHRYCRHYKYIVKAGEIDTAGLPSSSTQNAGKAAKLAHPEDPCFHIWIQPMDEHDDAKNAANLNAAIGACLEHGHRLSLQLHKIGGLP